MPYSDHPVFSDPPEETKLWRYMDMWKFESLLDRRALFFCRANVFSDPFEGASPVKEVEYRILEQQRIAEQFRSGIDEETIQRNVKSLQRLQRNLRKSVIVSSWNANSHESAAMWRLYLKDKFGVAVQSTPERLKESFTQTDHEVHAGRVRYLDYENDIYHDPDDFPYDGYNALAPFVHKRRFFRYENEYRALIDLSRTGGSPAHDWSDEENSKGKFISTDLEALIESVVVPPHSDVGFIEQVTEKLRTVGLTVDVNKSEMTDTPRF